MHIDTRISVLGPFRLDVQGSAVLLPKYAIALLAYLTAEQGKPIPRGLLAELLWAKAPTRARHSLSQLLYSLKALACGDWLSATNTSVLLNEQVTTDYRSFSTAIRSEEYAQALDLFTGPFLDGMPYITDAYDDWRIAVAAKLEAQASSACRTLMDRYLDGEDHNLAARLARQGLRIQPYNEHFARVRVESLASAGEVAKASRELEELRRDFELHVGHVPAALSQAAIGQLDRIAPVVEDRSRGRVELRLSGQTSILQKLRNQWHDSEHGCRVAVIRGQPGIGKSRVLLHAVRRAVIEGARPFVHSCTAAESRLPYSGVVGLLRDGYKRSDAVHLEQRWQQALAALAPELLPDIKGNNGESERIIWEAVVQYFGSISQASRVVIAIDDYQSIDERSKAVLAYMTKRLAEKQVLVVCAGRGRIESPTFEDDTWISIYVDVPPLSIEDIRAIIGEFQEKHSITLSNSAVDLLTDRLGGNPFLLVEALRSVLQNRGRSQIDSISALLSMESVASHLRGRIRMLSPAARLLAASAAIINRVAPLHLIARIAGVPALTAANAAAELVFDGIWFDEDNVRFVHDIFREAVYSGLTSAERSLWHLRVADVLASTRDGPNGEIAAHYEEAGDGGKALDHALLAGAEALALFAYTDAELQYQRALRCAPPGERRRAIDAFVPYVMRSARFNKLMPFLDECERYFDREPASEGMLACLIARLHQMELEGYSDAEALSQHVQRILEIARTTQPAQMSDVMWQVAEHLRRAGDITLLHEMGRMLSHHGTSASPHVSADLFAVAALLYATTVGYSEAMASACRAVQEAGTTRDPLLISRSMFARGTVHLWSGELNRAEDDFSQALFVTDRFAPDGLVESISANYSVVKLEQQDLPAAEYYANLALQDARPSRRAYSFGNLALVCLAKNDLSGCEHYVDALLEAHYRAPQDWIPVHVAALLGLVELRRDRVDHAVAHATTVADAFGNGVISAGDATYLHLLCARVDERRGRLGDAITALEEASRLTVRRDYIGGSRLLVEAARMRRAASCLPPECEASIRAIADQASKAGAHALAAEAIRVLAGSI